MQHNQRACRPAPAPAQQGFAYLAVLLFLAAFGAVSAAVVASGTAVAKRLAEDELLFVGMQFREAIRSYYEAGAGGRRYPQTLEELLRDPRFPGVRRHLRRIYADPLTSKADWGLQLAPEGVGIVGVYSKAAGRPQNVDNFPQEFAAFKDSARYADWVFAFAPAPAAARGTLSTGQPPGGGVPQPASPTGR